MLVVTFAEKRGQALPMLNSFRRFQIEPVVLALGKTIHLKDRIQLLASLLDSLRDEEVVLYCDASDSLCVRNPQPTIDRLFCGDTPLRFLMASEKHCWPAQYSNVGHYQHQHPSGYTYLHSGGFVGMAKYIKHVLKQLDDAPEPDDQAMFTDFYLRDRSLMSIDHDCQLFQCLFIAEGDLEYSPAGIRNRVTHNYPCIFQGNGNGSLNKINAWNELYGE